MSRHTTLIKNTAILAFGKFATQFIAFLLLPIYTRFLAPADYGILDLVLTYAALAIPLVTLRLELGAFRFLIDARNNKEEQARIVSTSLRLVLAVCAAVVVVFVIIQYFVTIPYGLLAMGTAIAMIASNLFLQYARGFGSNATYAIASIIAGLVTSIVSIVLVVAMKQGVAGILIGTIAGNVAASLYIAVRLRLDRYVRFTATDKSLQKDLLSYSLPLVPAGMSAWAINSLDRTLILIVLGLSSNGIYAIASKYSLVLMSVASVFGLAWKESASVHINDKDRDIYFTQVINGSLKLFGALGLVLIAITPLVFTFLFDAKYAEALLYIPIIVLAMFFNSMMELYGGVYVAKKQTKKTATMYIGAAAISILLNVAFISLFGLYAVAFSLLIAYGTMAVWRSFDVKKHIRIAYDVRAFVGLAIVYGVVAILYYTDSVLLHALGLLVAVIFSLVFNYSIVKVMVAKIKSVFVKQK